MTPPTEPFVSRAVRASKDSESLRVTIPQVIATSLGLKPGDEVLWIVDETTGVVRVGSRTATGAPTPAMTAESPEPG